MACTARLDSAPCSWPGSSDRSDSHVRACKVLYNFWAFSFFMLVSSGVMSVSGAYKTWRLQKRRGYEQQVAGAPSAVVCPTSVVTASDGLVAGASRAGCEWEPDPAASIHQALS